MIPILKNNKVFNNDIFDDIDDDTVEEQTEDDEIIHSSSIYEDIDEYDE